MTDYRRKLIEVALPLNAISRESAIEKSVPRRGHPQGMHLWWARRPLASCRAILFGQLVDDPSAWPEFFPTESDQDRERRRLFGIVEELVKWTNSTNTMVLDAARLEIGRSFARSRLADGKGGDCDRAILGDGVASSDVFVYLRHVVPPVHDPFAGGGSIPLEAQRLGLRTIASDLNPVPVLINTALLDIPSRFAGRAPVCPFESSQQSTLRSKDWSGARGFAEDVRRYGSSIVAEARKRLAHLYPDIEVTLEMGKGRAEAEALVGRKVPVVGYHWARTVRCMNPACRKTIPLLTSFVLVAKRGKERFLELSTEADGSLRINVATHPPSEYGDPKVGLKRGASGIFECPHCRSVTTRDYVADEGKSGRLGAMPVAVVAAGSRRKVYLDASVGTLPTVMPHVDDGGLDVPLSPNPRDVWCRNFGLATPADLFSPRQLTSLTTICDLVLEARQRAICDSQGMGWSDDKKGFEEGGSGCTAYGDAIAVALTLVVGRLADYNSTTCTWNVRGGSIRSTFGRQALPMTWDYYETNPLVDTTGSWTSCLKWVADAIEMVPASGGATVLQADASEPLSEGGYVICTDPPYYDNISYSDLSDFFYVWHRRILAKILPRLFTTVVVPRSKELVAAAYRHGGRVASEAFFLQGISEVLRGLTSESVAEIPCCIFYAFKQSEISRQGVSSTGWETFLSGVLDAGLEVVGTWPVRTERDARSIGIGTNALASSIVLVCRKRQEGAPAITRGELRLRLKKELPEAFVALQKGNIAPVDLAQASIGPGMAIFSRHSKVIEADGSRMSVRSALQLIHQTMDEVRGEAEGDLDRDTRFAVTWFESHGFDAGPYGEAETLATARAVSVSGVQEAGVLRSAAGKVRLYTRDELPEHWDPEADDRLTVWEATQHLIKRLNEQGEQAAATLLARLGSTGGRARILAYRLYTVCERKSWAEEAQAYNGLVLAWPDLERLAGKRNATDGSPTQTEMFE